MTLKKVCVIGTGPSGMSALFQFAKLDKMPDVVCYEKQSTWGGQWNFTWRTALDEDGEASLSSMYKDLWTNAPNEISVEYPDYTFEQHFGQPISSYPPVSVFRDYLEGRWQNAATHDLKRYIRFNTVVRHARFQDDKDNFLVITENLKIRKTKEDEFTHVIVCNGIFNVPNMLYFNGFEDFNGRIMHSHDFKEANEFRGQRVLIIGSSFSAEDVAIHCLKFGATHIIISYRSKATGLKWLPGIEERPLVKNFKKKKAFFKDDTQAEVDVVIWCTGYKNCFTFLESRLRIDEDTSFYPKGLYKSSLFLKAGNRKLFYIGAQHQLYTLSLFENIAIWVCRYIKETLPGEPVSQTEMEKDSKEMHARASMLITNNDVLEFQTDIMKDLVSRTGRTVDFEKIIEYIKLWFDHREEEIENYRNHCFRSMYTETLSPKQVPFMEAFDDSLKTFLKKTNNYTLKMIEFAIQKDVLKGSFICTCVFTLYVFKSHIGLSC